MFVLFLSSQNKQQKYSHMRLVSDGRMHLRERGCEKVRWMELDDFVMMVMDLQVPQHQIISAER
jgi:hypothetical protein